MLDRLTLEEKASYESYFSIDQENALVLKTLNILKEAKLRKKESFLKKGKTTRSGQNIQNEDIFKFNSLSKIKQKMRDENLKKDFLEQKKTHS